MDPTSQHAEDLLTKLRTFARTLASEERALLGALIAPAVARAIGADVQGFAMPNDGTGPLPDVLGDVLRGHTDALSGLGTDVIADEEP